MKSKKILFAKQNRTKHKERYNLGIVPVQYVCKEIAGILKMEFWFNVSLSDTESEGMVKTRCRIKCLDRKFKI